MKGLMGAMPPRIFGLEPPLRADQKEDLGYRGSLQLITAVNAID